MVIPTPNLSHLTSKDYQNVYEPAEDTFLLLDALEQDQEELLALKPTICLEIGSGSGCVTAFLGRVLGPSNALYLCTDINPSAALATSKTGAANKIPLDVLLTNLTSSLFPRLSHKVDILLMNPPYAVTPSSEVGGQGIEASWAGGINGREVIDTVLPLVPELLSEAGVFYLLVIAENNPDEICKLMMQVYGLQSCIVLQRLAGREKQFILKFSR